MAKGSGQHHERIKTKVGRPAHGGSGTAAAPGAAQMAVSHGPISTAGFKEWLLPVAAVPGRCGRPGVALATRRPRPGC